MRYCRILLLVLAQSGCQRGSPALDSAPAPAVPTPLKIAALPNGFRISDRVFSGGNPVGEAGFGALAQLGVKTIISVDGARPDVEGAKRVGIRYVHLPVGYDGISHERVLALAKAASTLPGPIYVHCHHGKHRGPAAVAAIQLCTDPAWDAARASSWLTTAGTDPRYTGLVRLPKTIVRPTADELATVADDFPSVGPIPDLARVMVGVDDRWDNVKLVKEAGWKTPNGHADIDPPHEALQLTEHFREAARLDTDRRRDPDFVRFLGEAKHASEALESSLRSQPVDTARAGAAFTRTAAACATCHEKFRDRPNGKGQ
jgi:protein tyrosine phosphatase (PTP) superfamily phosphohydrolase (DUF442 family)